jgi:hypothetical protein
MLRRLRAILAGTMVGAMLDPNRTPAACLTVP